MCEHQKKDYDLVSRQNAKLKKRYDENVTELVELRVTYRKATAEL